MTNTTKEEQYPKIAAAHTGPGPGAYNLPTVVGPSTATNKLKAPEWSIKLPINQRYNDAPGPKYAPDDNKLPAVTLKGRNFYKPAKLVTPAPSAYNKQLAKDATYSRAPSYSIGQRTRNRRADQVPASTKYTLPSLVGGRNPMSKSAPVASMSFIKPDHTSYSYDATKGPGPAAYHRGEANVGKRNPQYSLAARYTLPQDKTKKPGPGSYNPDKSHSMYGKQKKAPSFSMGVRHSQFVLPMITPADIY